jgi:hypothetical protein
MGRIYWFSLFAGESHPAFARKSLHAKIIVWQTFSHRATDL